MPNIREPDLARHQAAIVLETIQFLDTQLSALVEERDPRIDRVQFAQPSEQLTLLRELVKALAEQCRAFKNGDTLQRSSEPSSWRGSSRDGSDERLVARFAAGDSFRATRAREALRTYDELRARGLLGRADRGAESFVRTFLASGL
jgi:hypothetical protein